jgi:hypothetical protein
MHIQQKAAAPPPKIGYATTGRDLRIFRKAQHSISGVSGKFPETPDAPPATSGNSGNHFQGCGRRGELHILRIRAPPLQQRLGRNDANPLTAAIASFPEISILIERIIPEIPEIVTGMRL